METNPLILTLALDKAAAAYFTDLRDQHFPPERNYLKAHLTLFHQLPKDEAAVIETLHETCLRQKRMALEVKEPFSIGNGVAFKIVSDELRQVHRHLQQKWEPFLIPQDKQKLRPHITVQNKVKPATAQQLLANLKESFNPFLIYGTGFTLWEYQGGPWHLYKEYEFEY